MVGGFEFAPLLDLTVNWSVLNEWTYWVKLNLVILSYINYVLVHFYKTIIFKLFENMYCPPENQYDSNLQTLALISIRYYTVCTWFSTNALSNGSSVSWRTRYDKSTKVQSHLEIYILQNLADKDFTLQIFCNITTIFLIY